MVAEINALKRRLEQNPGDLQATTRLANLFHDVQMWDQALPFYERAIELAPDNPDILTDLGVCYKNLRRFDDALAMFQRAHGGNPDHWQSQFNIAVVSAFDLGDYDRALETLEPLMLMNPLPPQVTDLHGAVLHAREQVSAGANP